ncbi:hypothetical protein NL676_016598 [Syzygium grande]|nr:hypothetical protein NL676_016598 [Syzygium grande]
MSTTQLPSNLLLCLSLIFQCSFAVSPFGKIIPRFPSPLIRPENSQPSLSNDQSSNNGLYETRYFAQTLDHFGFRPESYQTFQQKYLINSTFWAGRRRNSPIFVYTGIEGDIVWFAQNSGFMLETAARFNALLVFIEVYCQLIQILKL